MNSDQANTQISTLWRIEKEIGGVNSTLVAIGWIAGIALLLSPGCTSEDDEAKVSACRVSAMERGIKDSDATWYLNNCMSAKGYSFATGNQICLQSIGTPWVGAECYERRGLWRSTKQAFQKFTSKSDLPAK